MRLTEREIRRRVRDTIILETTGTTPTWPDCTSRGTGPLPKQIHAALIKVCSAAASHIEQNYAPRPTGFGVSSDQQDAWASEVIAATKGDPVVERSVNAVLVLYRSLTPVYARDRLDFDPNTYLGVSCRRHIVKCLVHPWTPFNEFPDLQLCALVGTLSILCKSNLEKQGLNV